MNTTAINWTEKYRPKNFIDIEGQSQAIFLLKDFLKKFGSENKAVIIHGPPGTGKTSLAYAAANENKAELFELNASDLRNREKLREILRPATEQRSLTKENKIILVDEVDGISETDRGGLLELLALVESSSYPLIITANDIWDRKFTALRKKSELIQLKEIDYKTIKNVLVSLLRKEKKFLDNDVLTNISIKARGDLRAAINDLQIASGMKDPSQIIVDERNKEMDIFSALRMIFKGKPTESMLQIFDSVKMPIDEIMLWVEENIPAEYSGVELAKAIDALSKVDIFKRRIYRQQYWRFLVYENALLSYGISSAKKNVKTGFTSYKKPTRILKIWLNNQKNEKKKSIAIKYAQYSHVGEKRAMAEFSLIKPFLKNSGVQKELKLNEEEVEYLNRVEQSA
ncbi:MAG: replication factor C large subunit [Candidatus Pacearchaeota archaeon]|nr:replication factor C large subunit [Candidatus Pacearchaeota archaeon]